MHGWFFIGLDIAGSALKVGAGKNDKAEKRLNHALCALQVQK